MDKLDPQQEKKRHTILASRIEKARQIRVHMWKPNSVKPKARMTSKLENICSELPFKTITKYEGVIDYKIVHKIHRKIQENVSNIQLYLGGGHHGILSLEIQSATYRTITGKEFKHPDRTP